MATIRWWQGSAINEAAQWLSQWIGVDFKNIPSTDHKPSPLQTTTVKQIISPVFQAYAETCFKNISSSQYCYIAKKLGVSITALQQLMVGWSPEEYATSWPLRNGHGEVIGIRFRRVSNGAKWSLKGGRNGLAYDPHILQSGSFNRLWIAEGQSDTAIRITQDVKGNENFEIRYFTINPYLPVCTFASAVRNHWSIEAMHWTLDVTFREDSQLTSERTLVNNLSRLRRLAISMLKRNQKKGESIVGRMEMVAYNTDIREQVLSGQ